MLYLIMDSNLSGWELIAFILAYTLAIVFAFTVHEFSHAFVANLQGDPTAKALGRVTLNPFAHIDAFGILLFFIVGFGWAKPVQVNPLHFKNYKKSMAFVSLAGITANIIVAFFASAIFFFCSYYGFFVSTNLLIKFIYYFLLYSLSLNVALFIFNLIPIYPLDGFNFINSFLTPGNRIMQFMYKYGSIILIIFMITPLFDMFYNYCVQGIINIFFSLWRLFV